MGSTKAAIKLRGYREAVESDLLEQPAVQVWLKINPDHPVPTRVELLRLWSSPKPFICRLLGVGNNGSAVIAKRTEMPAGKIERRFYEDILPQLTPSRLDYYGCFAEGDQYLWLFLEDAGGRRFSYHDPLDREIAVRWLADLHTSSAQLQKPDHIIERGPNYYFERLTTARQTFRAHIDDEVFSATDRQAIANSLLYTDRIADNWAKVAALYEQLPQCIVHGDFKSKNIHLRSDAKHSAVFVFDWEYAGWGNPGIDMWRLDEAEYKAAVRGHWPHCDDDMVHQLKYLGTLFRAIDSYFWEVRSLKHAGHDYVRQKLIGSLPEYDGNADTAMRALNSAGG